MTKDSGNLPKYKDSLPQDSLGIDINRIVERNRRGDRSFSGNFTLLRVAGNREHSLSRLGEPNNSATVYVDGHDGYFISAHAQNQAAVIVGVVSYYDVPFVDPEGGIVDTNPIWFPRIVQMQGCTAPGMDNPRRRKQVMCVLSSMSLEDVCVDIAIEAARKKGQIAIGIQPAELNRNRHRERFYMDRARRRYDETAIRRGFKKDANGIYVLKLN